jgi:hypothetical protein
MRNAYEALEVLDTTSGITFRADSGWRPGEAPWHEAYLMGRIDQVVVAPLETRFTLSAN